MSDEAAAEHASSAPARRRRWPRLLAWTAAVTLVFGVVAGEIVARFVLGMGDPPLYIADPQIE